MISSTYSKHQLVPLVQTIFTLLFLSYSVNCDIFTLNNKYSNRQALKTFHLDDSHHREVDLSEHGVWERVKRDATEKQTSDSDLILDRSTLNGTQNVHRAFVHWIGRETSEKLVVLTCSVEYSDSTWQVTESYLWSSDDYGTSFKKKKIDGDPKISFFYTVPTDSKKLLFTDVHAKKVYTTSDELETFQSYDIPVNPDLIKPHPYVKDALLLYSILHQQLYSSTDFGKTWSLLSTNVLPSFYWAVKGYDEEPLTVHMEVEGSVPNQALYKVCIAQPPSCKDYDSQGSSSLGPFKTKTLIVHKEFMFVQKTNLDGSDGSLMISHKRNPFQKAYFPGNIKATDFLLVNLDDGQIFIGVNHGDKVNLYLSDVTGHFFVLSLQDVSHQILPPIFFKIDLHEVQGMNWTFIANARSPEPKGRVKTYISFDKGGNWASLQTTSEMKKDCKSAGNCNLKIIIKDGPVGSSILSYENAPGIILAHGTMGSDSSTSNASVFTSRDGGWTWKKAPFTGTYRFNILDQGSVLSAIPNAVFTSQLFKEMHYSLDEGKTWIKEVFDPKGLIVKGVLTEPSILTLTEMLFGNEGVLDPWTLVKLNFSSILTRQCGDEDYESWFPKDYNSKTPSSCTLGRTLEYKRRKQNALCHNGEIFIPRVKPNSPCECTSEDYECDFGYEEEGNVCKRAKWFYEGYLPLDCLANGTFSKTQGYRMIPADACVEKKAEKEKYGPIETPCEVSHPHGLEVTPHSTFIVTGREARFFLDQAGGSRQSTNYTWNFGDSTPADSIMGFSKASYVNHIFAKSGHYNVSVKAENAKGKSTAYIMVHVQDRISSVYVVAPKAGKIHQTVKISVSVSSHEGKPQKKENRIHYVWTLGDETSSDLPILSWDSTLLHNFKKAGTYDLSVEAVNSVSSLSYRFKIKIYDDAIIMVLTMKDMKLGNEPNLFYVSLLLERLSQQLKDDLGVESDRIEVIVAETTPVKAHLYIFPSSQQGARSSENIRDATVALVKSGEFGINLFGKRDEPGKIFKVDSIEPLNAPGSGHGPNLTPVYIAVPVLIIILLSSVVLFFYCRRKIRNVRQYNLLNTQDDSDALLDDDDVAPLDLDIDFGIREPSGDNRMLDSGNHLVMVTGDRSDGFEENC